MGTDVYLTWDKMTKKEEKDQMTGFSISSGDKGYLRASISMTNENALLRSVFPDNWEEEKEYDFKNPKNMMRLELGARLYLLSALKGEQVIHRDMKQNHEFGEMIRKMVKEAIGEKGDTIQGSGMASIGTYAVLLCG